jgi:AcrR family transcriptional regulator
MENKPYHHGDLRRALIETYAEMLQEGSGWEFSLRETARRAGVSHSAAYKHFPDKASLLAEVAMLGFTQLGEFQTAAQPEGKATDRERFLSMCHSYVDFGINNPSLYRLMFSAEARECANPKLLECGLASLGTLEKIIEKGQQSGWLRTCHGAAQQAHAVWAQMHGLTILSLDGLLASYGNRKKTIEAALDVLLEGMASAATDKAAA